MANFKKEDVTAVVSTLLELIKRERTLGVVIEHSAEIHVHVGIEEIAEMLGAQIQVVRRKDKYYPLKKRFYIDGIEVFELCEES